MMILLRLEVVRVGYSESPVSKGRSNAGTDKADIQNVHQVDAYMMYVECMMGCTRFQVACVVDFVCVFFSSTFFLIA